MKLSERLAALRKDMGLSQEAIGSQGFVSGPGWIKLENGQRQPSERLINNLVDWLTRRGEVKGSKAKVLREELLTLKYMSDSSAFVRDLAKAHARNLPNADELLAERPAVKAKRGRPVVAKAAAAKAQK